MPKQITTRFLDPLLIAAAMLAAGCSSNLSKEECLVADWYVIGIEDGSKGLPLSNIGRHREACAKASIAPDLERYQAGLNKGYGFYCTVANGYDIGKRGLQHHSVCTGDAGAAFHTAHKHGNEWHQLHWEKNEIYRKIDNQRQNVADSLTAIADYEDEIVLAKTTSEERRRLLDAIKEEEQYIDEVTAILDALTLEYQYASRDLEKLTEYHSSLGY